MCFESNSSKSYYLHEIRFLVEVGRAHGGEGDPLQLVEAPPLVEDVAQPLEQRELVGQRNLRVLEKVVI